MSLKNYLKDKLFYIVLLLFSIISIQIFLIPFNVLLIIKIYIAVIPLLFFFITFFREYYKKNAFYSKLKEQMQGLQEKYLITEIMNECDFEEERLLLEIYQDLDKSMVENVNKYKYMQEEYKDFIEAWIHEIKIPIATRKNDC